MNPQLRAERRLSEMLQHHLSHYEGKPEYQQHYNDLLPRVLHQKRKEAIARGLDCYVEINKDKK
jgi:hypothetical protein